jgi:hypothetical protein
MDVLAASKNKNTKTNEKDEILGQALSVCIRVLVKSCWQ